MESWGFVALVVAAAVGLFVATRLVGRSERNRDDMHGGGFSSSEW